MKQAQIDEQDHRRWLQSYEKWKGSIINLNLEEAALITVVFEKLGISYTIKKNNPARKK